MDSGFLLNFCISFSLSGGWFRKNNQYFRVVGGRHGVLPKGMISQLSALEMAYFCDICAIYDARVKFNAHRAGLMYWSAYDFSPGDSETRMRHLGSVG